jgi:hypothetical protein
MNLADLIQNGVIVGTALLWILNKLHERKKKAFMGLDKNLGIDSQIYSVLWDLKDEYLPFSIFITQYHNGSKFYTGQHIQRKTVSHEKTSRFYRKVKDYNDNVLLNQTDHKILVDVQKCEYFWVNDREDNVIKIDEDIIDWMKLYNAQSMYVFRITDKQTNQTVATLHMLWDKKNPIGETQIYEIQETMKKFEAIFDKL